MNRKKFKELVGDEWFDILDEVIDEEVEQKLDFIKGLYSTRKVYPSGNRIFRAFEECKLNDLKVIFLAQDPYINGEATGLCLDCSESPRRTKSFDQILQAYEDCYPNHFNTDILDGNLLPWAKQGVLLLNTALTVLPGKSNSLSEHWFTFTLRLIRELDKNYKDLIFVGFGKQAEKFLGGVKNKTIVTEHPAYAARQGRKWKHNDLFHTINLALVENKLDKIDW